MLRKFITPGLFACICLSMALGGCATAGLYHLPPPVHKAPKVRPPTPEELARQDRERYLEARAAVVKLYGLLVQRRYKAATGLLSQDTRDFLGMGSPDGQPEDALAAGKLKLPGGRSVPINPVTFLLAKDISVIKDTVPGVKQHETSRRKVLFAIQPSGKAVKIVMIKQGGKWVLQRTAIRP